MKNSNLTPREFLSPVLDELVTMTVKLGNVTKCPMTMIHRKVCKLTDPIGHQIVSPFNRNPRVTFDSRMDM